MSSLSRVILAFSQSDADVAAASSLALGFGQVGAKVDVAARVTDLQALVESSSPDLVVASLHLEDDGGDLLKVLSRRKVPVVVLGDAERRLEVLAAGATDLVGEPAYVRDVVTLGRFVGGSRGQDIAGELAGLSLYHLVRALGAAGRMGALHLSREGRHGELKFHQGELTSVSAGRHHGLAAFHQLLLWPDAKFDWRTESVVRQQQIPLTPAELSENVERFLRDYHEMSCGVPPSMVFEPNLTRLGELSDWVPKEAQGVVELFDGRRTLADVIQDSPLRLPDTLLVAVKLIEVGVLRKVDAPRTLPNSTAAPVVEDWLVGAKPPATVVSPAEPTPAARATDWGALDPAKNAADFPAVVPAESQSGEIKIPPLPHILASPPIAAPPVPAPVPVPAAMPAVAPPAVLASPPVVAAPPVPVPIPVAPPPVRVPVGALPVPIPVAAPPVRVPVAAPPVPVPVAAPPVPVAAPPVPVAAPPVPVPAPPVHVPVAPPPVPVEATKKVGKNTGRKSAIKGRDTGKHKQADTGRHRAVRFEDHEQAFFDGENELPMAPDPVEDFSDLDDGVPPPQGFFRRLWNGIQGKGAAPRRK